MTPRRRFVLRADRRRSVAATCLAALGLSGALAGCGSPGSSGSGGASPTQVAPPNALAYVEISVRPPGDGMRTALRKVLGRDPGPEIRRSLDRTLGRQGLSYEHDLQTWLGPRIALAAIAPSADGIALIADSTNSSAAVHALETVQRRRGGPSLAAANYRGVGLEVSGGGAPLASGIVKGFAVLGGVSAVHAVIDASKGDSLARSGGSAFGDAPSDAVLRGYADGKSILGAILAAPGIPLSARSRLSTALAKASQGNARIIVWAQGNSRSLTFDLSLTGKPSGSAGGGDVGGLPAGSWLAIAIGGRKLSPASIRQGFQQGLSSGLARTRVNPAAVLGALQQQLGFSLQNDLLPALGPFELAVQGNSVLALSAGLLMRSSDPAAAGRLLATLYRTLARAPQLGLHGSPEEFSFTTGGRLPRQVAVSEQRGRIVATFNLPNATALTNPAATLSSSPMFARARAGLPASAKVPLFVDFGPVANVLAISSTPSAQKAQATLKRLDYLALGVMGAPQHVRLVLGLR